MKANELKVYYEGKLDPELDKAIEKCFEALGYERWASGYSLVEGIRDIAFDKKDVQAP